VAVAKEVDGSVVTAEDSVVDGTGVVEELTMLCVVAED